MKHGGFRSTNLLDDAILIATVETGVPLVAFDADRRRQRARAAALRTPASARRATRRS